MELEGLRQGGGPLGRGRPTLVACLRLRLVVWRSAAMGREVKGKPLSKTAQLWHSLVLVPPTLHMMKDQLS